MLSNLKISDKTIVVEYPRFKDFKIKLRYIPREELMALREKCVGISFDRVERRRVEQVDSKKFIDEFIRRAIVGWEGLTVETVSYLVPIDATPDQLSSTVPYSHEDAMWLVENSTEFDSFINDTMNNVEQFSANNREKEIKK